MKESEDKKYITGFVKDIATENYSDAMENLRSALAEKIKDRIRCVEFEKASSQKENN